MEQRDYILREIEKISVVLLAILGKFRKIKSKKQFEQERIMIDNELDESSGLTLNKLLGFRREDLIAFLKSNKGIDLSNAELLSDLLVEFANHSDKEEKMDLINKAVIVLEFIDDESKTFSFSRAEKISGLDQLLRNIQDV